jgi:hypothetical protein
MSCIEAKLIIPVRRKEETKERKQPESQQPIFHAKTPHRGLGSWKQCYAKQFYVIVAS